MIGLGLGVWTLIQAYSFTSTAAAWNEFDQAPSCPFGKPADSCRASMLVSLTVESHSSGCTIYAYPYPPKGLATFRGFFSKDTCSAMHTGSRVQVEVWQGQLVKVPGTSPWAACISNTPYFSPHACSGAWSDDSALGQHWSALPSLFTALLLDAGFVLIVLLYVIGKVVGFIGRHV